MARQPTGQVIEDPRRPGVFGLRFRAYGKREYEGLGRIPRAQAEQELQNVLADVRRGIWRPKDRAPAPAQEAKRHPTFYEFACGWFDRQKLEGGRRGRGLSPKGVADLEWRLSNHLLPYFASSRLDAITIQDVDSYRLRKVRDGRLGPTSVNKTLATLAAILEVAVEYEWIGRNPAKRKRRRLRQETPARTRLDRADHISALLAAAGELDTKARSQRGQRRALVALLVFAGLRIGEALALRWRDVDLARGEIRVRTGKTEAAERTIYMEPILRDELASYRAGLRDASRDGLVFATSTGRPLGATSVRKRIVEKAVAIANEQLEKRGTEPLPGLTPHSLRRTFATLLCALDRDIPFAKSQMGHKTASMLLDVYAGGVHPDEKKRLAALVRGDDWAANGQQGLEMGDAAASLERSASAKRAI
jgi:integrase